MRVRIHPGTGLGGVVTVPGDKSISHRWLILAATARGRSRISGLPPSLDVRSTATCLARLSPEARPGLDAWLQDDAVAGEGHGSTWNIRSDRGASPILEVEGEGRGALVEPDEDLPCGNSGTTMRLLAGVLAAAPFRSVLAGDRSLSTRPMERVADPLRAMGASVRTKDGHGPIAIEGGHLHGIRCVTPVPTAQVKSAVLLAGLEADGVTSVAEPAPTRDHTERALAALGAPVRIGPEGVSLERFQHGGFEGAIPGDVSSAAFLIAAAALTRSEVEVEGVGLNPSRIRFLDVIERMGLAVERRVDHTVLGEPVGSVKVAATGRLIGTKIEPDELPLIVDEVPILAVLGAFATGETWFLGAAELRAKESDRLAGVAEGIRRLGGHAGDEGDDLVVAGTGLTGGSVGTQDDHRLAMAFAVAALGGAGPSEIDGIESAAVSFPGFVDALRGLGATVEDVG
jgi:3-phosphoshikimate 1-carboxyvinyltransferase